MKKTYKRVLSLLVLFAMMLSVLAGCGGKDKPGGENVSGVPEIDEPVTLTVLTQRHTGSTTDAGDLWFFKYMEYWFAEQGYDVTIKVQQTNEAAKQTSLLLGTNSLPDIVWGIGLGRSDIMQYGVEEEMVLNWTPYLNESLMPNLVGRFAEYEQAKIDSTAPDGNVYALPYFAPSQCASGCYGTSERLYFRQSWLDACGVQNPTTQEEFLDVLRAFKKKMPTKNSSGVPLVSAGSFLEKYLWTGLGYYGTEPAKYGSSLMIKDGKIVMPAYTEDYKTFIDLMKTMYSEGLIAKDYFSMDEATAGGMMRDNACGALCWWTLEYVGDDFSDIVCANPITFGDNQEIHVSRLADFTANTIWASSKTQYPALVAMMIDFIYSDEGAWLYRYGPAEGEDPLDLVDGWKWNEDHDVTTKLVEDGTYSSMSAYGRDRLFPFDNAGLRPAVVTSGSGNMVDYTDSVTGKTYQCIDNLKLDDNTNDGHWRLITIDKWSSKATSVRLHGAYLDSDSTSEASDLITIIQQHISNESAKFITGQRPVSEIDAFQKELKDLGIERYLDMYTKAYADYMTDIFG